MHTVKGSLTRDFRLQIFFHKSLSPGPLRIQIFTPQPIREENLGFSTVHFPQSSFYKIFYCVQFLIRALYAIFVRRKSRYLRKFPACKSQKDWVRKLQMHKVSHLRTVRKSNKVHNLRVCDSRNLFADRPPLTMSNSCSCL
jgi:hypothetical protein